MTDSYVSYRTVRDLRHKNMLFLNIPWIYVIRCLFMQCSCSTNFKGIKQKIWILIVTNHSQSYVPLRCVALNSGFYHYSVLLNYQGRQYLIRCLISNITLHRLSNLLITYQMYILLNAYTNFYEIIPPKIGP